MISYKFLQLKHGICTSESMRKSVNMASVSAAIARTRVDTASLRRATWRREKMMVIRDSLKELHNILLCLQRVNTRQKFESDEALARLEESRKILIERLNQCSKMERNGEVLEEVITFIGDGKSGDEFPWNLKMEKIDDEIKKNNVNGVSRFLVRTTRFGLEFVAIFACMYTSVRFCESRKQNHRLQNDARDSLMARSEFLPENIDLDVLYGRG